MNQTIRSIVQYSTVALAFVAFASAAPAQPVPVLAAPGASTNIVPGTGPMPSVPTPAGLVPMSGAFPPMLVGVISPEEYRRYSEFQQHLSDDPALKELETKIRARLKELQQIRAEANAVRERLIAANPEALAIRAKITAALFARTGAGPALLPVPAKK